MKKFILDITAIVALIFVSLPKNENPSLDNLNIEDFAARTSIDDVIAHPQALKDISETTGDSQEAGTPGYDLSSHYIAMKLISALMK